MDPLGLPLEAAPTPAKADRVVIVQADGDLAALRTALEGRGARILHSLRDGAWIARVPSDRAGEIGSLPGVRWIGEPRPSWKLAPEIGERTYRDPSYRAEGRFTLDVDLFPAEDGAAAERELAALGATIVQRQDAGPRERIRLRADRDDLERIAAHPAVEWIEEAAEGALRNDTTRWVIQSNVPGFTAVWDRSLRGEGQIIGLIDDPIDMDSCYFRDPLHATAGPSHRKVVAYRSAGGAGAELHGTHTAGTAAGDRSPINGSLTGNGNAYAARISYSNYYDITGFGNTASNLFQYLSAAHADGARVHSNSWGDDGTTAYTTWCRDVDQFSWTAEDSLVVFSASNASSLRTPENAKNCLAVGASLNGGSAGEFCEGGAGPTSDGRRKPEVYAPGCGILSAEALNACGTTALSGTSMASPAVAAAGALVRQYFTEGWYPSGIASPTDALAPTGALLKAMLVDSAVNMTGIPGYPGWREGWGRVLLENVLHFAGETRSLRVRDVRNTSGLSEGGVGDLVFHVTSSSEPLRVTLVFTDPPASLLAAEAWVNDLDLEVRAPDGVLYLGNVFAGGASVPGGEVDPRNNVERVLLPSPPPGDWLVTVRARSVPEGPQGYALVVTGAVTDAPGAFLALDGIARQDVCLSSPALSGNGDANPGESVVLRARIRNAGDAVATAVAGALASSSPFVQVVDGSAEYPDIPPGEAADPLPGDGYTLVLSESAPCGAGLSLRHASLGGATPRESVFSLAVQANPRVAVWSDDFETNRGWAVSAPNDASKGKWQRADPEPTPAQPGDDHTPSPGALCWATGPTAGPNVASNDVDGGSTTILSPAINLAAAVDPEVSYWRWYSNDQDTAPGEDSWVVQVSFDNGTVWSDLERTVESEAYWTRKTFRLRDFGAPTSQVRLRAIASDLVNASLVEAAFDDVTITDSRGCFVCPDATTLPGEASPIGAAPLLLSKAPGDQFDLTWSAPSTGGRPSAYAFYRTPFGEYTPACETTVSALTETRLAIPNEGGLLVVARNDGGEGPYGPARAPAPTPCP